MSSKQWQWLIVSTILVIQLVLLGGVTLAHGDESANTITPAHPHYRVIKKRALALGFDISKPAGRQAYGQYLKEKRIRKAAELGFDITTPAGRKAYRIYRNNQL